MIDNNSHQNFETFKANPILYGKAYLYLASHLKPVHLQQQLKKEQPVLFNFNLKYTIDKTKVTFLIDNGLSAKKVKPEQVILNNLDLSLKHSFKNQGLYDVHLYIEDALIATYVFEVKKEI